MGRIGSVLLLIAFAVLLQVAGAQQLNPASPVGPDVPSAGKPGTSSPGVANESFVIGADDVLAISVWKEPELSKVVPVRSDGKISLPLIGELQASGSTPKALESEIRERLKAYMSEPEVTVMLQEIRSRTFNVLGEVFKPGAYPLVKSLTVVDAIALAGGFRDFAKKKSMYVLRTQSDGEQVRISVNYKDVIKGKKPEQNIVLQSHDVVVVP